VIITNTAPYFTPLVLFNSTTLPALTTQEFVIPTIIDDEGDTEVMSVTPSNYTLDNLLYSKNSTHFKIKPDWTMVGIHNF
jgi:hypothetical protein